MELDHIGGVFGGNVKPTPFLCLILKMLQIQPSKDIVVEFIKNPDYKLVCCLSVCVSVCVFVRERAVINNNTVKWEIFDGNKFSRLAESMKI